MTDTIQHVTFLGDGEKTFALTGPMILELERKTGAGIGAIYRRFLKTEFRHAEMAEVIRLALIGGGTDPKEAAALVAAYVEPMPLVKAYALAFDVLEAAWNGSPAVREAEEDAALGEAITGDDFR